MRRTPIILCTAALLSCAKSSAGVGVGAQAPADQSAQAARTGPQPDEPIESGQRTYASVRRECPGPLGFVAENVFTASYGGLEFEHDSDVLRGGELHLLRMVMADYFAAYYGDIFDDYQAHVIQITGYRRASEREDSSLRRAQTVASYLRSRGIPGECMTIYDGATRDPSANDHSLALGKNRQLDLKIVHLKAKHPHLGGQTESDGATDTTASDPCPRPPGFVPESIFTHSWGAITFEHDSAVIPDDVITRLDHLLSDYSRAMQGHVLLLTGHRRVSEQEQISLQRAQAVEQYLIDHGIPKGCLVTKDESFHRPFASEYDAKAAITSRVEITVKLRRR